MSSRSVFWAVMALLAFTGPVSAQAPSPLELVQGIREAGMPDLALEYLKEVEGRLDPADKLVVPLERAKCLLEAAEEEPDEGTRTSMVNEAKEGFNNFLTVSAAHPRASEASLAIARLTSLEAKAQLNRSRRLEIPPKDDAGYQAALDKQREEAKKARPLFLLASQRFGEAATQIKAKLEDKALEPKVRQALSREAFDADVSSAINQYYLADTFIVSDAKETIERDKYLEDARGKFAKLAEGAPQTSRTLWVSRAWMAEVLGDQGKPNNMNEEFKAILDTNRPEAEEGKRLVQFFQVRRAYLDVLTGNGPKDLTLSVVEARLRSWVSRYGGIRKPTPESLAARYYLAFCLQRQAQTATANLKPSAATGVIELPAAARKQFEEAEKLYRTLSQTDHDYTNRSAQNRMFVVRKLLGEADKPLADYPSFETAQMAALIQMAKLNDAEKVLSRSRGEEDDQAAFWHGLLLQTNTHRAEQDVSHRKYRVVALLERARELAGPADTPADVTDNLLRLVYFYQVTGQPYQAAVLGEHIARTVKTTGGKGAIAGMMALNGYTLASSKIKADTSDPTMAEASAVAAAAAKKVDRERAIEVAKFLDDKFPNDTATDVARHRLATMLNEDGKPVPAFEAIVKIRPGYTGLANARQLEGFLASVIVNAEGVAAERKVEVFRRAVQDLLRVNKPGLNAVEDDVRGFVGCRVRLAYLFLAQDRVDPETEKTTPGHARALAVADEVVAAVPGFDCLNDKEKKALNPDGLELQFQGMDVRTRALYLQAKALVKANKLPEAGKVVDDAAAGITQGAAFDARMKKWSDGTGDSGDDEATANQKAKIAGLASGVDKVRRDIVMVGFKLRCVQGDPPGAGKMLELLKAAGGGIEANQASLELMARELAALIPDLQSKGKAKEAADLGAGLAILLNEFTSVKDLNSRTIRFLGQTYQTIGDHERAIAEFAKIKTPSQPDWETRKLEEYPQEIRAQLSKEISEYRFAQLAIAKSLRLAGRLAEAEKHLLGLQGTADKKRWGFSSLEARKEIAAVYEGKGAASTTVKEANTEWGKALKEWTTLFTLAQRSVSELKPDSPADEVRRVKSNFFEAYFEVQRVVATANVQLIKDPTKLAASLDQIAKRIKDLETVNKLAELQEKAKKDGVEHPVITPEVWTRYCDLLDKQPVLKNAYVTSGGKFFLERPKVAVALAP